MNKQPPCVYQTLIQSEMPDSPLQHFSRMMEQALTTASCLPSLTNGEALRAEDLGEQAQTLMTKTVGLLDEMHQLTGERLVLDVMNGLEDLKSELAVPQSAIRDLLNDRGVDR